MVPKGRQTHNEKSLFSSNEFRNSEKKNVKKIVNFRYLLVAAHSPGQRSANFDREILLFFS